VPAPAAYRLVRLVRRGPRHRVSLAEAPDGTTVVLKQVCAEQASTAARLRLRREFGLLRGISSRFVPWPIGLQPDAPEPTLVLPQHDGSPLDELSAPPSTPADFLEIAHQAALALQDVHRAGVLHLAVNPTHLVWSAARRQLTLVGFSSAVRGSPGEETNSADAERVAAEGALPFLSPEQAGVLSRPVDNRCDLYSLGITLYRLAAGVLPFSADDALGWAHAHLTARPEPLAQRRPDLPAAVGAIVHRLIAKSPDERYQTAWGLAHDLARCRDALAAGTHQDDGFALGERDLCDRLNPTPALQGRAPEQAALRSAWQRSANGAAEVLLIAGDAGLGKTALVHELRPEVLLRDGVFLHGRFAALQRDVPYAALRAALGGWLEQRFTDPPALRERWVAAIGTALAGEAGALLELLPRLPALLGELPEPTALDAAGTRRRLGRAVAALLAVMCGARHPVLWAIDNLQWADAASIALLQELCAAGLPRHLLLVVAHRSTEPESSAQPVLQVLRDACGAGGTALQTLSLRPLAETASAALVRDMLRAPADAEAALAQALHARAAGNPQALVGLLAQLRAAGVLRLDPQRLRWTWDAGALQELLPGEPAVDPLLRDARLPPGAWQTLALAASIGREFNWAQLAELVLAEHGADLPMTWRVRGTPMIQRGDPDHPGAVAPIGFDLLAALGVPVDPDRSEAHRRALYAEYRDAWRRGAFERLREARPATGDPLQIAAARTSSTTAHACADDPPLRQVLALQALRRVLAQGPASTHWSMYAHAALMHMTLGGDYRAAMAEWPFWLEAVERHGDGDSHASQLWWTHARYVLPWNRSLGEVLQASRRAAFLADRAGQPLVLAACFGHGGLIRLEAGEPLELCADEVEQGRAAVDRAGTRCDHDVTPCLAQMLRVLRGQTAVRWSWDDTPGACGTSPGEPAPSGYAAMHRAYFELAVAVLANLPARAAQARIAGEPLLEHAQGELSTGLWVYYGALAEALQDSPDAAYIGGCLRQLESWSEGAPTTFAAKAALVRAELHRIAGRRVEAVAECERAIALAQQQHCLSGIALAEERLARLCLALGWEALGHGALARARQAYAAWGATAKLDALDDELGVEACVHTPRGTLHWVSTAGSGGSLEFEAVLKASQAISHELDYERLLQTLVRTLLQYAGADHAALLLLAGENLEVAAHAAATPDGGGVADASVAWSVPRYAHRTGETLLLDDPARDDRFARDPYLQVVQPQSLLCLPVRKPDGVLGFIYLENRATAHAFSRQHLRVLDILVGHVVGALDNARLVRDLRDSRDQLDEKVRERTCELEQAREVAEAATRAKGDFLAKMSHEIRTPMNAILGMTHLALRSGLNARQRNFIEKAERAAKSLLGLVNDILDLSKIEAGKLDVETVEFALAEVLGDVADLLGLKAQEKGLALRFALPDGLPCMLVGDPLRLRQVLVNLGHNAIKFTERGEVTIGVEEIERGAVGGDADGPSLHLAFTVADTGVGMSEQQQRGLFEPFVQADNSITRRYGGTGLGLAISRQLVELMHGTIEVDSQPGQGSRFRFSARFALPAASAAAAAPPADLRGVRVLIVDDNAAARALLVHNARVLGLQVDDAADGWAALRAATLAAEAGAPFDIALIAQAMPQMDGVDCAVQMRAENSGVRRVLLMAAPEGQDELERRLAREQLHAGRLAKPVTPASLLDACTAPLSPGTELRSAHGLHDAEGSARWHGTRILLVEDNEINQELAHELLTQVGVAVTIAHDGRQALALMAQHEFDGVLMDCQMPVMDGYETTRAIRRETRWRELPIIAMTANAMAGDRVAALAAGMNDHIAKPIDVTAMLETLARWVRPGAAS